MTRHRPSGELQALVQAQCNETLSHEDRLRLETLLLADAAARHYYLDYFQLHGELFLAASSWYRLRAIGAATQSPSKPARIGGWAQAAGIAGALNRAPAFSTIFALAFLFMGLTFLALLPKKQAAKHEERPSLPAPSPTIARIERADDCVWGPGGAAPANGRLKVGGRLELREGTLVLRYLDGARVALQAPVNFVAASRRSGQLLRGRLAAEVPPAAHGFEVQTPSSTIVDLGTKFGVFVDHSGRSEVHVLEGRVETRSAGAGDDGAPLILGKEEAAAFDADAVKRIVPRRAEYAALLRRVDSPAERWKAHLAKLTSDPRLVLHLGASADQIDWTSRTGLPRPERLSDGSLVPLGSGRLRNDASIRLEGSGQHLVIEDAPELQLEGPLSLAIWCRLDKMPAGFVALVQKGAARNYSLWLRPDAGRVNLHFSARSSSGENQFITGRTELQTFQWMHAVGVVDQQRLSLYLNGRLEAERDIPAGTRRTSDEPLLLGRASQAEFPESLRGDLDDLMLFQSALSAEEVAALYEAGKPQ